MPVLPEVESMIVFPCTSEPRRSPSSIIHSAARSLTDPPGLNHSAFAYTSTRGKSLSKMRTRSSGVLPISRVMPAETVPWVTCKRIERSSVRGEVDQDQPADHVEGGKRVTDQRAPVDAAAFEGQDVEDRLADQVAAAEQGDRRRAVQDPVEQDGGRGQHLAELPGRVDGRYVARACVKSSMVSSFSAIPSNPRTGPSRTPSTARSAGVSERF